MPATQVSMALSCAHLQSTLWSIRLTAESVPRRDLVEVNDLYLHIPVMQAGHAELQVFRNTLLAQRLLEVMSGRHDSARAIDKDLSFISTLILLRKIHQQLPTIAKN